jgi:hypothetical protein
MEVSIYRFLEKKYRYLAEVTPASSELVDFGVLAAILGIYYDLATRLEPNGSIHFLVLPVLALVWLLRTSYRNRDLEEVEASRDGLRATFTGDKNFQTGEEGDEIE